MLLSELLFGVSCEVAGGERGGGYETASEKEITSVVIDSRQAKPGALFICIRGLTVDGHDFIRAALDNGASALLVEELPADLELQDAAVIKVENTRGAMAVIAANFYGNPARGLRLIGVTGTNGKTTTTHFIEEILRKCGRKTGLIGSEGVSICGERIDFSFATSTTPDPLELHLLFSEMLARGVQDVVMEVSSHALHFHKVRGLVFAVGVFTNLTQDHLDLHGTMDNYRVAKAQLFRQSEFAVLNIDDESTTVMLEFHGDSGFVTYGINNKADLRAERITSNLGGSVFDLVTSSSSVSVRLSPKGRFNVYNALAAIGTVRALKLEMNEIIKAVGELSGVPGRIQSVPNDKDLGIYVDNSHTPDSLENILHAVREFTPGRLVCIFGCGGDRDRAKRPQMGEIATRLADFCIITSDNPRTEDPMSIIAEIETGVVKRGAEYTVCENRRGAIFMGAGMLKPGDALVIAGKGSEDYQIIGTVKHRFNDYETAVEALNRGA